MLKRIVYLFTFCILFFEGFGIVSSPIIRCVSVDINGDVTVTWDTQPDPFAEFISYQLYNSTTPTGPYANIASISTYTTTSYTFLGAGANFGKRYFFIKTLSNTGFAAPYDTVRSIFLTAAPMPGFAQLAWNAISSTLHPTSDTYYKIYREFPSGTWSFLDSTQALTYNDTIYKCSVAYNYRIEIGDLSGCKSVSNIAGGTYQDLMPPNLPVIDSVSVNAAGQAIIGLFPSASPDAECYVVYKQNGLNYITLDTVCGNIQQVYTYLASLANFGNESFGIASIDSCKNISIITNPQSTMYLQKQYNLCAKLMSLTWTPYQNMKGGLNNYRVMVSVNGGPFSILGTTSNTYFIHANVNPLTTYCYYISAINVPGTITSSSNKLCQFTYTQTQPTYIYVHRASVTPAHHIDISVKVDNAYWLRSIHILRSDDNAGPYQEVGSVPYSGAALYSFNDATVSPDKQAYYYKVQLHDSCDIPGITSNISKTVLLTAYAKDIFINALNWDDYDGYLGGVVSYNIYRAVDGVYDPSPIANIPYGVNYYEDNVDAFAPAVGKFSYYVEAIEGAGNPYGFVEASASNRVDVYQEGNIFIPNAFTPRGYNKLFLPETHFIAKTDYKLTIFDRWGQKVWETADEYEGWNGSNKEEAVYVYLLQFKTARGEFVERKGTVTLLR